MNSRKLIVFLLLSSVLFGAPIIGYVPLKSQIKHYYYFYRPIMVHHWPMTTLIKCAKKTGDTKNTLLAHILIIPASALINTLLDSVDGRNADKSDFQKIAYNAVRAPLYILSHSLLCQGASQIIRPLTISSITRSRLRCILELGCTAILQYEPYMDKFSWNVVNRIVGPKPNDSEQNNTQKALNI